MLERGSRRLEAQDRRQEMRRADTGGGGIAAVRTHTLTTHTLLAAVAFAASGPASAQDRNVLLPVPELEHMLQSEPLRIVSVQISRPKVQGDITLKAEVAFGERPPMRIKIRRAEPGADTFNNVPRYE